MGVASELITFVFPEPYFLSPSLLLFEFPIAVVLIEGIGHWQLYLIIHSFSKLFITFGTIISFAFLVEHTVPNCLMPEAILFLYMGYRFTKTFFLWALNINLVINLWRNICCRHWRSITLLLRFYFCFFFINIIRVLHLQHTYHLIIFF